MNESVTIIGVGIVIISTLVAVVKYLFSNYTTLMKDHLKLYRHIIEENNLRCKDEHIENLSRIKEVEDRLEQWKMKDKQEIFQIIADLSANVVESTRTIKKVLQHKEQP